MLTDQQIARPLAANGYSASSGAPMVKFQKYKARLIAKGFMQVEGVDLMKCLRRS